MDRNCGVEQLGSILLAKRGSIYKLIASLSHLYGQQSPQEQVGYLHQGASEYWYHIRLISLLCVNSFQPRFDSLQGTVAAPTIPQCKSGVEGTAWASLSSLGRSIRQDTSVAQRSHWNLGKHKVVSLSKVINGGSWMRNQSMSIQGSPFTHECLQQVRFEFSTFSQTCQSSWPVASKKIRPWNWHRHGSQNQKQRQFMELACGSWQQLTCQLVDFKTHLKKSIGLIYIFILSLLKPWSSSAWPDRRAVRRSP